MLKFSYKHTIRQRVTAKCQRHPRYNPEKEGRSGMKGGCGTCWSLFDLQQARLRLEAAIHEFERNATPWTSPTKPRTAKAIATAATGSEAHHE